MTVENTVEKEYDEQGRVDVRYMSDSELLRELVVTMRSVSDGLKQFETVLAGNPMLKALFKDRSK